MESIDDGLQTRFLVVNRKTGQQLKTVYEAQGFFTFHHGNAYERDGHLVVDMATYNNGKVSLSKRLNKISIDV